MWPGGRDREQDVGGDASRGPVEGPERGTASVLGRGLTLTGKLEGAGDLRVEGRLDGDIEASGTVVVAPRGQVEGTVRAAEVVVAGRLSGRIEASRAARFAEGCRVEARVRAPRVAVEEGAMINGRLEMSGGRAAEPAGGAGSAPGARPTPPPAAD